MSPKNNYLYVNMESDNKNGAQIGTAIRPLCDALNDLPDVCVLYALNGIPKAGIKPYVTFTASERTAFQIHQFFDVVNFDNNLYFNWWLTSRFRDDGSIRYTIELNDCRTSHSNWEYLALWFSVPRWDSNVMDNDLLQLASLVGTLKNHSA
jgi:hypothetical protein